MICTYIFEDNNGTLADSVNIKDPKIYIELDPTPRSPMWSFKERKIVKNKDERYETVTERHPVRLVGAVLSVHDEAQAVYQHFANEYYQKAPVANTDNSIYVPEYVIGRYVEEQGEWVRGVHIKPGYITPIITNTDNGQKVYYAVSFIHAGSTYKKLENGRHIYEIQPDLPELADKILDLNGIAHAKHKPFARVGYTSVYYSSQARVPFVLGAPDYADFDDQGFEMVCCDMIWYGANNGFSYENNLILPEKYNTWVYVMPKGTIRDLIDRHMNSEKESELFPITSFNIYNDKNFIERITKAFHESGEY